MKEDGFGRENVENQCVIIKIQQESIMDSRGSGKGGTRDVNDI